MNPIFHRSPNFDANRKPITTVVIHWFGRGTLESADQRFLSDASDVSAHYGISGDIIYQWVEEKNVAYHAGNYEINQRSIGIEHDATLEHEASEQTYQTSGKLVADICKRYAIPIDDFHIIPHKQVTATQCPGTIDIQKIMRIANGIISSMNDQTIIDLGPYGKHEIQAIRGFYGDALNWQKDLGNARKENEELKKQLKECQERPLNPPNPSDLSSYSALQLFNALIKKILTK